MYPPAEAKVVYKEPLLFLTTVFIQEALVAKFRNYTKMTIITTDTKRAENDTLRIPVHTAEKTEDYRAHVSLHRQSITCSKTKIIAINDLLR